jgi:hypothetical protein
LRIREILKQKPGPFTRTGNGRRLDCCAGVEAGSSFLAVQALLFGTTEWVVCTDRPAAGRVPLDLALPSLPE